MRSWILAAGALLALASAPYTASPLRAESLRFAAYGDMPYNAAEQALLSGPAAERIRSDARIGFVISLGDLGRPEDACSDQWQEQQRQLWQSGFGKPVFHTPGDNDWTDCDRATLPAPSSELARLDALRRIHFSSPPQLDPEWQYRAQPGQPENAMWRQGGARFATLHVVGTMNGRTEVLLDDRQLAAGLADSRDTANRAWLAETFRTARAEGSRAVVIAMQADVFDPRSADLKKPAPANALERCFASSAFAWMCQALVAEAAGFDVPVLLVHGDTSQACIEPIVAGSGSPVFWRLNAWGDFVKPAELTIIDVDAADRDRPFRISGLDSGSAMPPRCEY